MGDLKGKIIIIAGGHGKLGSALMKHFNGLGAIPISWDLKAPSRIDVTSPGDVNRAFLAIAQEHSKKPHGFVMCCGYGLFGHLVASVDSQMGGFASVVRVALPSVYNHWQGGGQRCAEKLAKTGIRYNALFVSLVSPPSGKQYNNICGAVEYFLSDLSRYVTGSRLVMGGML